MSDSFWNKIFQDFPSNLDMSENYYTKMIILLICSDKRVSVILDHICVCKFMSITVSFFFISPKNGTNKNNRYLNVLRLILSVPIRLHKGNTEQKQLIHKWFYLNISNK